MNKQPKVNRLLMNISIPEERSTTKKRKELDTMHGTEDNFKEAKIISRERWQK